MKTLIYKGLLNVTAASAANLDTDSATLISMIVADNTANPLVPIINYPIRHKSIKKVTKRVAAAEVRRIWTIGVTEAETIKASTKYTIGIDHVEAKTDSEKRGTGRPYSYTSPAVLTGTASTDRTNLYTVLAAKINAFYGNYIEAKAVSKLTVVAAGNLDEVAIGGKIFQTDSTYAAATWEATIAGWNTAGTEFYVYDQSGTLNSSTVDSLYVVTASPEAVSTDLEAVELTYQGLVLVDDAGYWVTPEEKRAGASIVTLEAGFTTSTADIIVDRVYAQGIGTEMLLHTPVYSKSKEDALSGDMNYTFLNAPVAGKTYTLLIIDIENNSEGVAGFGHNNTQKVQLHLFCEDTTAANVNDLETALNALR